MTPRPYVADRRLFRDRSRAERQAAEHCELCEWPHRYRHLGHWVEVDFQTHHDHGIGQRAHAGQERDDDLTVVCVPCHKLITRRHNQLAVERNAGKQSGCYFTITNDAIYSLCVEQATNEARFALWRWRRLIWARLVWGRPFPTTKETP